jgi:flagellar biosynthesis protein FlhG
MGVANAAIMLGLNPAWTLADLLARHCELSDIIVEGPGGVRLVPGHIGIGTGSALPVADRTRLLAALAEQAEGFDHILLDTGAGVGTEGLGLVAEARTVLVALAPEPTAFMDAYALVKALSVGHGVCRFAIVTNMVDSDQAGRALFDHFESVITRFIAVDLVHAGSVPDDPYVREAVRRKRCCVEAYPSARASKAFNRIAARIVAGEVAGPLTAKAVVGEALHGTC